MNGKITRMDKHNDSETHRVLDLALKAGRIALQNGAEIFRVEETIEYICRHFGIEEMDAFVLSNGIFLTAYNEGQEMYARVKHVPAKGTHLGIVAEICDKVAVMYAGEIVEKGDVSTILTSPRHPYTQGLLAAVPRLDGEKDAPLADIPGTVPPPTDWPKGCAFHPRCPKARKECSSDEFNILCKNLSSTSTRCIA